ncbi:hypothetical protein Pmar_PMAR027831 [Perkinsus marinus ATCC 50983]|uniref:Uncharacterized protein n=1 Tax=Perkinsus marinus (strain ATCC 50983 / TXsc) TaxID=423536 RepID=C5LD75_PERM5|nr:hypothetical protein Pmar_PMAR027831 [Perkinsus marinus ATCC 50983]EER05207.1 hypothetical protein Pmar_PMAR027831 [Perkinsus marinus ATCC 50983]|eukprot:XP_002773391.1 hypothetical protein Pmar_PMAR027831 [Perkinsus marinus ATCC 50983]
MGLIPDRVVQLEPSQEDILRLYSESVRAYEELYAPYRDRNDRRITSPTAGSDRSAVGAGPSSPSSSHDESRNSGNEQQRGRSDSAELPGLYAELNTVRRDKAALEQQVSSLTESQMVLNNQRRLLADQLETARAQVEQCKAENSRLKADIEAMRERRRDASGHDSVLARAVSQSSNLDGAKLEFYREQMSILARENQRLKAKLSDYESCHRRT